ncbi:hypothetical protein RB614_21550 [Phytohabitans sp. ZYX-F-186]|uniref:DNA translocase FtsK 4TM region domain-containing protein n=1 Tax=Phytohabitans maris TaxID=3071409 RepID=A0ABU0ZME4_9ACTN|nr:hypothetical protein [Phytohabitans sp. ZYX-F-186]MDQ7907102.1 hypothetical protein [Phytohabitans sp. ZYX-F-186]
MSQEPQADIGARLDEPAVVEFGADEPARKRPSAAQVFKAVRRDWRLVPVIAGLSAVAVFASIVGEWQTITFTQEDMFGPGPTPPVTAGLVDLGGFGTGYLIGIFVMVGCLSLVLFGRPALRDQVRIVGLAAAGVSAAILVGITAWLDGNSAALASADFLVGPQGPSYELAYGRGVTMAFLGVAGFALALYLAGRLMPAPPAQPAVPGADGGAGPAPEATEQLDWPWRRPRAADDLDSDLPPPADLTVAPTAPFVPMQDGRTSTADRRGSAPDGRTGTPDARPGTPDGKRDAPST